MEYFLAVASAIMIYGPIIYEIYKQKNSWCIHE